METKGNYIIKNAIHDTKSLYMELQFLDNRFRFILFGKDVEIYELIKRKNI